MSSNIVCNRLTFSWPDGESVLTDLDFHAGSERTGLIGVNGSGKSTLLRLMAGILTPTTGTISVSGDVGYLPQTVAIDTHRRVDQVLGIADVRAALASIEAGSGAEQHFAVVGDDWDIQERTRAVLGQFGLAHLDVDRSVGEVSGGEAILLALAALFIQQPSVLLLDEPTNNLDYRARHLVYQAVAQWRGTLVVVSHDRELLERVDRIADLHDGQVRYYGGNLSRYEEVLAAEQETAERLVRAAESDVKRQKRELVEARIKLDRRARYGQKMADTKRSPKILANGLKQAAQVSAGKHRNLHQERLADAQQRLHTAEDAVRVDDHIRVELPQTVVPSGRQVLHIASAQLRCGPVIDLDIRGPERIALIGLNGSGKTTLLRAMTGDVPTETGVVEVKVPARWLPQRLDILHNELSIVDNVTLAAPTASDNAIRAQLARFLLRGAQADQQAATLSGGERFRASLATLLLAEPAPQLFLLDEPTNNLDMASVDQLAQALACYQGALIIASHDMPFLRRLGLTRWLHLGETLTEVDPQ